MCENIYIEPCYCSDDIYSYNTDGGEKAQPAIDELSVLASLTCNVSAESEEWERRPDIRHGQHRAQRGEAGGRAGREHDDGRDLSERSNLSTDRGLS